MKHSDEPFSLIFGEITPKNFVENYLNKRPLLLKRNDRRFSSLMTPKEFFDALQKCETCRAVFKDLLQASIRPSDAEDLFRAGATICASGLDRTNENLSRIVEGIRTQINYSGAISLKGYLSPDGAGFAAHYDTSVTTTLQLDGSKTWCYSKQPLVDFPLANTPSPLPKSLSVEMTNIGYESVLLAPGDLLCLPAGTVHWAEAAGTSLALNLSFEYINCGIPQQLASMVEAEINRISPFRAPLIGDGEAQLTDASIAAWRSACLHASQYLASLARGDNLE